MAEITLKAATGRELGSGPSKRIRVEGKVPGVVYGLDADPIPVTVEWKPLREALTTEAGLNALINLEVDGDVALTVVKELQRHPIRGNVLHIDFLRVSADAEITVEVPIVLEGEAAPDTVANFETQTLLLKVLATAIPQQVVVSIEGATDGTHITAADVKLPEGAELAADPELLIVNVTQAQAGESAEDAAADESDAAAS